MLLFIFITHTAHVPFTTVATGKLPVYIDAWVEAIQTTNPNTSVHIIADECQVELEEKEVKFHNFTLLKTLRKARLWNYQFQKYYLHHSRNKPQFIMFCVQRFYALYSFMLLNNYNQAWFFDSDISIVSTLPTSTSEIYTLKQSWGTSYATKFTLAGLHKFNEFTSRFYTRALSQIQTDILNHGTSYPRFFDAYEKRNSVVWKSLSNWREFNAVEFSDMHLFRTYSVSNRVVDFELSKTAALGLVSVKKLFCNACRINITDLIVLARETPLLGVHFQGRRKFLMPEFVKHYVAQYAP